MTFQGIPGWRRWWWQRRAMDDWCIDSQATAYTDPEFCQRCDWVNCLTGRSVRPRLKFKALLSCHECKIRIPWNEVTSQMKLLELKWCYSVGSKTAFSVNFLPWGWNGPSKSSVTISAMPWCFLLWKCIWMPCLSIYLCLDILEEYLFWQSIQIPILHGRFLYV